MTGSRAPGDTGNGLDRAAFKSAAGAASDACWFLALVAVLDAGAALLAFADDLYHGTLAPGTHPSLDPLIGPIQWALFAPIFLIPAAVVFSALSFARWLYRAHRSFSALDVVGSTSALAIAALAWSSIVIVPVLGGLVSAPTSPEFPDFSASLIAGVGVGSVGAVVALTRVRAAQRMEVAARSSRSRDLSID